MRKWKFYEVKWAAQGYMAVKRQNQDLNQELFNFKSVALKITYLFIWLLSILAWQPFCLPFFLLNRFEINIYRMNKSYFSSRHREWRHNDEMAGHCLFPSTLRYPCSPNKSSQICGSLVQKWEFLVALQKHFTSRLL